MKELECLVSEVRRKIAAQDPYWDQRIGQRNAETELKVTKLTCECDKLEKDWHDGQVPPDLEKLYQERRRLVERDEQVFKEWRMNRNETLRAIRREFDFLWNCATWLRQEERTWKNLISSARVELSKIVRLQEREHQRLYPSTGEEEQIEDEESLADKLRGILEENISAQSPVDRSSFKGYVDVSEGAHQETQGVSSRSLLGVRGSEAVQVSSHRGPPTDIPPDKPPPWKGASRGYLLERAGTRHVSQLVSFTRSSYCSSGNAYPLADNAIMGSRAIEQFCVRAAGSSQESRTHASRAGRLRGVVGPGLTGHVCDKWSPSSKPGS
jgi:hypothetical protein